MVQIGHRKGAEASGAAVDVPDRVRLELLHGYVQLVAERHGVRLLHLKGAAVHEGLRRGHGTSFDVDVLVHPDDVAPFLDALSTLGWERLTGFEEGSAFGHATNMRHELGLIDLHRHWPGFEVSPVEAFETLWSRHEEMSIAEVPCPVPSLDDQRLILLLHHARSGSGSTRDLEAGWADSDEATRRRIRDLAKQFDAELALAAALGQLENFRSRPGYALWRYFVRGEQSRWEEWWGRYEAATGVRAKMLVLRGLVSVNADLLRFDLGREPTTREYAHAYRLRLRTAVGDLVSSARRRRKQGQR
ncbi:nucleotidyltransferase family protein [Dermacoccus sp. PE3]|uniref:nucleotidyltransferase family protein n=1 Tax=Dermacoccus sp. PE3 TaxID=1641401 RepID=UPI00069B727F|nr:nucleotidyltransferase family protein [Dermacoccus sp. PE3]